MRFSISLSSLGFFLIAFFILLYSYSEFGVVIGLILSGVTAGLFVYMIKVDKENWNTPW